MHSTFRYLIVLVVVAASTASATANDSYEGKRFPPFKAKDAITGKPLSLEGLRGKVVLIDFWATWCGPCVRELPNVKQTYHTYKDRGFEVVSVSLDSNPDKFERFVRAQKMNWHHVMEGGGWKTRLAKKYRINSIPAMYLIDHNGVCISDRARGPALEHAVRDAVAKIPAGSGGKMAAGDDDVDTGPNPAVEQPEGVDISDSRRVLVSVAEARERLDAAAAPVAELGRRLAGVQRSIASIDRRMPEAKSPSSLRRRYIAMRDELTAIRREMYVCGMLNDRIPTLPGNPFADPDVSESLGLTLAWGELPNARECVEALGLFINVLSRQFDAAEGKLDRLERMLARSPGSVTQAERAETLVNANRLAERCHNGWEQQMTVVGRKLANHDGPESEALREELAAVKAMLADENADAVAARKRFAKICGKVLAIEG